MLKEENKYLKNILESLKGEEIPKHMNNNKLLKEIDMNINYLIETAAQLGFKVEKVNTLPTTNISTKTLYLTPKEGSATEGNLYDEWLYSDNDWEHMGDTGMSLTNVVFEDMLDEIPMIITYNGGSSETVNLLTWANNGG